jgi:hypothetical protein
MHMSLGLCPLLGAAALLAMLVWAFIRSPKVGGIVFLALGMAALLGLFLFRATSYTMMPAEAIGSSGVGAAYAFSHGRAKILVVVIALLLLALVSLTTWGFARNPKKGFAIVGGLFLSLLLVGMLSLVAAIVLPAIARARQIAAQRAAVSTVQAAGESRGSVLNVDATTRPSVDAVRTDPWLAAAASSTAVGEFACRELACAALSHEVMAKLLADGRGDRAAGRPFVLAMEADHPPAIEVWKAMEFAIRAGIRAAAPAQADDLVRIEWSTGPGRGTSDGSPRPEDLVNGAVLRWYQGPPQAEGRRSMKATLTFRNDAERLGLVHDDKRPPTDLSSHLTTVTWRTSFCLDKAWVLGTHGPSGRPGPFIVARSQPMASMDEARQAANEIARRTLADTIRAQLERVVGSDSRAAGPEALVKQADTLVEEGARLAEQARQLGVEAGDAASVRGLPDAGRIQADTFLSVAKSFREQAARLREQAARASANVRGQDAAASAESRALSASAQGLERQAETLETQARRAAAGTDSTKDAARSRQDTIARTADTLEREAQKIRDRATKAAAAAAAAARSRGRDAGGLSDAKVAAADAIASQAVGGAGSSVRLDDYTQMIDSSSGTRWMTAVLLDASPAAIDGLVGEALAASARKTPSSDEIPTQLVAVAALLVMIILAYAFLVAGRYGYFKWPLRVMVAVAFAVLFVVAMHFFAAGEPQVIAELPTVLRHAASVRSSPTSLADQLVPLAKASVVGVEKAVGIAMATDTDDPRLKPLDLLVCGEYRLLGGYAEEAVEAIKAGIRRGGTENWYQKSLGLALLRAGRDAEAKQAFGKAAGNADSWTARPVTHASMDAWTAAYFLDLVTEAEYADCWKRNGSGEGMACFPWFYVGQRMEIGGDRDKAIAAYRKSVKLGERPGAHYIQNWSAYRLGALTGTIRVPASRLPDAVSSRPAERPDAPAEGW